jgi:hypothetical protein
MDHEQTKLFRINLLRQLAAAAPLAVPVSRLLTGARLEAFDADEKAVQRECAFLAELSPPLLTAATEAFSAALKRYKLTPAGREYLETEGF